MPYRHRLTKIDEIIVDFIKADSARLLSLYDDFYINAISSEPGRIEAFADRSEDYIKCARDLKNNAGDDYLSKTYPKISLDDNFGDLLRANSHRLIALPAVIACQMQNRHLSGENEVDIIHKHIREGLSHENERVRDVTLCNLVKTTRRRYKRDILKSQRRQYFLQQKINFNLIYQLCVSVRKDESIRHHKNLLANFILNSYALGESLESDLLKHNAEHCLDKLLEDDDPLVRVFIDIFKNELGRLGHLQTPHMTEVTANAKEMEIAFLRPEIIFIQALAFCDYFLAALPQRSRAEQKITKEKFAIMMDKWGVYENIFENGVEQFSQHLEKMPEELAHFVIQELKDMISAADSKYQLTKESMVVLKNIQIDKTLGIK